MDLVKYFSGSRVFGTAHWKSDLDNLIIYKHRLIDILRGVWIEDWDHYPKDGGDMYEIQKFMNEIHQGNNFLTSVLVADCKEVTTSIWEKVLPKVKELALMTSKKVPTNMWPWVGKNMKWLDNFVRGGPIEKIHKNRDLNKGEWELEKVREAIKRSVWVYYWTRQSMYYASTDNFVIDPVILMVNTDYGTQMLNFKQNLSEEIPKVCWCEVYNELKILVETVGDLEWTYEEMNTEANQMRCDIIQEVRLDGVDIISTAPISQYEMTPGARTSYDPSRTGYGY